MILLPLHSELIGLRATLVPFLAPFAKTSNNQIHAVEVLLVWRYGLEVGAEPFDRFTRDRLDPFLRDRLAVVGFDRPIRCDAFPTR